MINYQQRLSIIADNIENVFLGKREVINMLLIACLAQGHVLIEDVPGVGKTSLANALSQSFDASFKRIQFTPDTTPSDIVGFSMYNTQLNQFDYVMGAVLNNIVLADELNRTSPKTQAALLEVMQDQQVTVDGNTYPVPQPFMLIATQNPSEQFGTYPLPESQLDRFMMTLSIGYPSIDVGVKIINDASWQNTVSAVTTTEELLEMQTAVNQVHLCESLSRYIVQIAVATRTNRYLKIGISTRGTILLSRAAKAKALMDGRDYVLPDDIKKLVFPVLSHRLILGREGKTQQETPESILGQILTGISIPQVSQYK